MNAPDSKGRSNQRKRTRKAILEAASRLSAQGRTPTLEEVAEEALVSRATAYRYFPNVEALIVEAAVDFAFPDVVSLFATVPPGDAAARLQVTERAFHEMIYTHEPALKVMIANSLAMAGSEDAPVRQNRRTPLIEAALDPVREKMDAAAFDRLVKALAIIMGTESMIVCRDVLGIEPDEALEVKLWAIDALLKAALRSRMA